MAIAASKIALFLLVPLPLLLGLVLRLAGVSIADFARSLAPSLSAAGGVGLVAFAGMSIVGAASPGPVATILAGAIPATCVGFVILAVMEPELRRFLRTLKDRLLERRRS